jgi:mono/diheme cytochrome c family protein
MTSNISRIIAPVILVLSGPALAQPDARRGLSLAREHCAQCHAIDNAGESPLAAALLFATCISSTLFQTCSDP